MRTPGRFVSVSSLVVLALASGNAAWAGHRGPVQVSHESPFAGCTVGAAADSVLYPGAEVEPSVTADPFHPAAVVGAWQQDRWSDGGAHGLVAGYSTNGGKTFTEVPWPVSRCAPGGLNYERASDPWVSAGAGSVVYGSALVFDANSPRNGVVALTSYDGGRSWRNVTEVIVDTEPGMVDDKNTVTADAARPGSAYQVWDRLELSPDGSLLTTGPTLLSITRDHGRTWSRPQVIVDTGAFQQTIGNVIVVNRRTGELYNFYESIQYTDETATDTVFTRYEMVRSTDAGRTWSRPVVVVNDTGVQDVDPNTGAVLRTGVGIPFPAIDPWTGELYLAYEGSDFTGGAYNQIQLVRSTDRGRTWSAPTRVNGDPSVPAFTPSITVAGNGDVGVTYYDVRSLRPGNTTTLPTSTWLTVSPRGGRHFDRERQLAPVFDMLQAPQAGGYFVGDYEGLTAVGDEFRALFVTTHSGRPDNRTDVYYAESGALGARQATTAAAPARAFTAPARQFSTTRR